MTIMVIVFFVCVCKNALSGITSLFTKRNKRFIMCIY